MVAAKAATFFRNPILLLKVVNETAQSDEGWMTCLDYHHPYQKHTHTTYPQFIFIFLNWGGGGGGVNSWCQGCPNTRQWNTLWKNFLQLKSAWGKVHQKPMQYFLFYFQISWDMLLLRGRNSAPRCFVKEIPMYFRVSFCCHCFVTVVVIMSPTVDSYICFIWVE